MRNNFDEWLNGKNIKSDILILLRKLDDELVPLAEETRRGNGRISFGTKKPKRSIVILFWNSKSCKIQIKTDHYSGFEKFDFKKPTIKQHFEKGFVELKINSKDQINKLLIQFLKRGLKN